MTNSIIFQTLKDRSFGIFRTAVAALLGFGLSACAELNAPVQQEGFNDTFDAVPPPNFTRGLIARSVPEPLYPVRARNLGLEGWVVLSFTVDEEGLVVSNSIRITEEDPKGYFDLSAINAARRLIFENTRGRPVEDVSYVFRYELEGVTPLGRPAVSQEMQFRELIPRRYITPAYPLEAERAGVEGYVVVQFSVTPLGDVENVSVIESQPQGTFDAEALIAASRLYFEPRLIFGQPVRVDNVTYRFDWRLPR